MQQDKVSVIIPVYNVEKYLCECVESVLKQTYTNLEIILVDDGSVDNSGYICDSYAAQDDRVKVIHKKNGGPASARNAALDIAIGEYITFVDSDDYISPVYVEILYNAIKDKNAHISMALNNCRFCDGENPILYSDVSTDVKLETYTSENALEHMLYQRAPIAGMPAKLYKSTLFSEEKIRFSNGFYAEDLGVTYQLFLKSSIIVAFKANLYAYRVRQDGLIHQKFSVKKLSCINISQQLYGDICEQMPSLQLAAASRCVATNRMVYAQIPFRMTEERRVVWNEIRKYRFDVLCDSKARKRERLSCLISYLGPWVYYVWNAMFLVYKHKIKKR